jgi:hypothetical protein
MNDKKIIGKKCSGVDTPELAKKNHPNEIIY